MRDILLLLSVHAQFDLILFKLETIREIYDLWTFPFIDRV